MSNTALSSARRRRAVPPIVALTPQQQQQQQQQQQRMMELQRQQQLAAGGAGAATAGPYTQRPNMSAANSASNISANANARLQQSQSIVPPQPQFIKPGSVIPPGYVQTIHANGMPQIECVETGTINFPYGEAPLPPIIILRNHDKQLIQIEGQQNDFINQLTHITSRIASFEGNGSGSFSQGQIDANAGEEIGIDNNFINELTGNQAFISSAVESIMKNTNLSDMVNEIDPIKADNRELRSLLLSQQEMLNGMNSLLFKLLNTMHNNTDTDTVVQSPQCAGGVHDVTVPVSDDRNDSHFGAFEQSPQFHTKTHDENNITTESISIVINDIDNESSVVEIVSDMCENTIIQPEQDQEQEQEQQQNPVGELDSQ